MTTCDLCTRDSLGLLSVDLAPPAFPALLHSDQPEEDDDDGDDDSNDPNRHDDNGDDASNDSNRHDDDGDNDSNDHNRHDDYDDDALLHSDQPAKDDDRVGGEGNMV